MIKGDEKLLFLSDIDGEREQHIERLVESAGPVFDAIFEHVDDPPATPVADDPQKAVKWLKRHVREPIDTYFAYEDASVQDIKECARAAGFTGSTSQGPLLTYMSFESRLRGFRREARRREPGRQTKGNERVGCRSGRCMSHIACPLSTITLGFFTIFDGDFEKYFQDFADKSAYIFDAFFHTSSARRQPRSQRTPRRSISGDWTTTIRPSGSTAPIPASRFRTSERCWPIARHRPPRDSTRFACSRPMLSPVFGVARGVRLIGKAGDDGSGTSSPCAWSKRA